MSFHNATPAELFKRGYDTLEIAKLLQLKESTVVKILDYERAERLGRPYPYLQAYKPRVPFAGKDNSERPLHGSGA